MDSIVRLFSRGSNDFVQQAWFDVINRYQGEKLTQIAFNALNCQGFDDGGTGGDYARRAIAAVVLADAYTSGITNYELIGGDLPEDPSEMIKMGYLGYHWLTQHYLHWGLDLIGHLREEDFIFTQPANQYPDHLTQLDLLNSLNVVQDLAQSWRV